jgi:hypothetical protein
MTDSEYINFLRALAGKHLRPSINRQLDVVEMRTELERLSKASRLLKVLQRDDVVLVTPDVSLMYGFLNQLGDNSVTKAADIMDEVGILPALDDAPSIVFGELRRSAVPPDDIDILKRAGGHTTLILAIRTGFEPPIHKKHQRGHNRHEDDAVSVLCFLYSRLCLLWSVPTAVGTARKEVRVRFRTCLLLIPGSSGPPNTTNWD